MGARRDRCARRLFQREDDRPKSIKVRLEAYRRSTPPLIDFYRLAGLLLQVSAAGTLEGSMTTLPDLEARRLRRFAERMWAAEENRRDT
jgi:adenylate kinase